MKPTILIVDDEPGVRAALSGVLRDEDYSVEAVPSGEACLDRVSLVAQHAAQRRPHTRLVVDDQNGGLHLNTATRL